MIAEISYDSRNLLSNRKHQNFVICAMSHNHEAVPFQFIDDLKAPLINFLTLNLFYNE